VSNHLDAIGRELEQRADQVDLAGAHLVQAATAAIWTSIAADAFRAQVARRRRDCADVGEELRAAGRAVRHFAVDVESEQARLRRVAVAAEHTIERGAVDVAKGAERVASWLWP
jgi:uncharacterized protein YukE